MNLFEAAQELLPPGVRLERRGCLGRCGSGPNLALNPSGLLISYCATPAQLANLIERQCLGGDGTRLILHAFEVRAYGCCGCARQRLWHAPL
jgi:(2Fe-2S) ferredoxin